MKQGRMNAIHLKMMGYEDKESVCEYADKHGLIVEWNKKEEYYILFDLQNREEIILDLEKQLEEELKVTTRSAEVLLRSRLYAFMYVRIRTTSLDRLMQQAEEFSEQYPYKLTREDVLEVYHKVEEGLETYANRR